jgi:hypothetical protein
VARGADATEVEVESEHGARGGGGEQQRDGHRGDGVDRAQSEGHDALRTGGAVEPQPGGQQYQEQGRGRRMEREIDGGLRRN